MRRVNVLSFENNTSHSATEFSRATEGLPRAMMVHFTAQKRPASVPQHLCSSGDVRGGQATKSRQDK